MPVLDGEGNVLSVDYCGCDCYKALHGISLMEKIVGRKEDMNTWEQAKTIHDASEDLMDMTSRTLGLILGIDDDDDGYSPDKGDPSYALYRDVEATIEAHIIGGIESAIDELSGRDDIDMIRTAVKADIKRHKEEEAAAEAAMTPEEREEEREKWGRLLEKAFREE